ncbi:MAG TPA: Ig-like domain-containing protein [Candidatus Aminicenantes bacterium]|nr:Ig-like domain-containing protein [Candidatus Aminicenantes bacterium]HRY66051.1 Ig-like domain-containing protein [Candidatus Aminicenantes bacterium]HRZ72900.1 Ig-like domain-containing protein [Candidatus Aminicenantes bacterium]
MGCLLLCLSACNDRGGPTLPVNALLPPSGGNGGTSSPIDVSSSKAAYFIGETETFTATMKGTDGVTVPVTTGTWSSYTPGVATVTGAGMVTVVGQGWADISCTYNGLTGSRQIWGRADCRGAWSGTYSVENCGSTGDFLASGFCATHGGSGLPVELVLAEEGQRLVGTITLGGLSTPVEAKLGELDGSLEMEGRVTSPPYTINIAMGCGWDAAVGTKFVMTLYYTGSGMTGGACLSCRVSLSKTGVK